MCHFCLCCETTALQSLASYSFTDALGAHVLHFTFDGEASEIVIDERVASRRTADGRSHSGTVLDQPHGFLGRHARRHQGHMAQKTAAMTAFVNVGSSLGLSRALFRNHLKLSVKLAVGQLCWEDAGAGRLHKV